MITVKFEKRDYEKMGCPSLGDKIPFVCEGEELHGEVALLSFCGFEGADKGRVLVGLVIDKSKK